MGATVQVMQRLLRLTSVIVLTAVAVSTCVFSPQKAAQTVPVSAGSPVFQAVNVPGDAPGGISPTLDASKLIFVVPIEGVSSSTGLVLADAIAATLRDAGKPAVLSPVKNEMGPSVSGRIISAEEHGSVVWVTALWELLAPYGTSVAEYRHQVVVDKQLWSQGSAEAINLLIADAGPQVAKMVHEYVSPMAMTVNLPIAAPLPEAAPIAEAVPPLPATPSPTPSPPPAVAARVPELPPVLTPSGATQALPGKPVVKAGRDVIATLGQRKKPAGVRPKAKKRLALITPLVTPKKITPKKIMPKKKSPKTADKTPPVKARKRPILRPVPEAAARPRLALKIPQFQAKKSRKTLKSKKKILMPVPESGQARVNTDPPPVSWKRPSFLIKLVEGAPGDGNVALTRAMKAALRKRDITVTEDPRQAGYIIKGKVEISAPVGGRQQARIVWEVNTIGGDEVGKAVQENAVKAGSLDTTWGRVADIVSNAAVAGIRELFGVEEKNSSKLGPGPKFSGGPDLPQLPGRAIPPP